ncbi:capsule biosynthesis protein [Caminibacter pacificus]
MNSVGDVANKNILLLQGPMGDFFKRLDEHFRKKGAKTFRIGFNAGDFIFSNHDNYTAFRGKKKEWRDFFIDYVKKYEIDKIFLFGDCRFYQSIAIQESQRLGIETFVFEEGYVRPDFVTLEKWGVNNFSLIPRDPEFYRNLKENDFKYLDIKPANPSFFKMAWSASWYYIFAYFGKPFYPYYEHHRELNPFKEAFYGIRNAYRKYKYKIIEKGKLEEIVKLKYFFVPLQTYNDFQLKVHSKFQTIEEFIELVIKSFSLHAPKDTYLVLKHHPMDRGRRDYKKLIEKLGNKYGVKNRLITIYDLHLPTLLNHTLGTVTINSTVGLQAMYHNSPVKVLGNAIYDIKGLADQKYLSEFWQNPEKPDKELFRKFRQYLIDNTQINGSFYGYFDFDRL